MSSIYTMDLIILEVLVHARALPLTSLAYLNFVKY